MARYDSWIYVGWGLLAGVALTGSLATYDHYKQRREDEKEKIQAVSKAEVESSEKERYVQLVDNLRQKIDEFDKTKQIPYDSSSAAYRENILGNIRDEALFLSQKIHVYLTNHPDKNMEEIVSGLDNRFNPGPDRQTLKVMQDVAKEIGRRRLDRKR